jgi:hypothetical protein
MTGLLVLADRGPVNHRPIVRCSSFHGRWAVRRKLDVIFVTGGHVYLEAL